MPALDTRHSLTSYLEYSERLVTILDEKIAASMALRARENSESGVSTAIASPALEKEESLAAEGETNAEQPPKGRAKSLDAGKAVAQDEVTRTASTSTH
jgi:hypothetical protein